MALVVVAPLLRKASESGAPHSLKIPGFTASQKALWSSHQLTRYSNQKKEREREREMLQGREQKAARQGLLFQGTLLDTPPHAEQEIECRSSSGPVHWAEELKIRDSWVQAGRRPSAPHSGSANTWMALAGGGGGWGEALLPGGQLA